MARASCPFPDRFRCVCRLSRYQYGCGYVDDWVECEARKDNGWYRFYEVKRRQNGTEYLGGECYRPSRWKELQIALERAIDIQLIASVSDDTEDIDLSDLL